MIDVVTDALDAYLEAKADLERASEGVEYDRPYFLAPHWEAVNKAKEGIAAALDEYIDNRIVHLKQPV